MTKDDNTELEQARVDYYQNTFIFFIKLVKNTFISKADHKRRLDVISFTNLERKWDIIFEEAGGQNWTELKRAFLVFTEGIEGNGNEWRDNMLCQALVCTIPVNSTLNDLI